MPDLMSEENGGTEPLTIRRCFFLLMLILIYCQRIILFYSYKIRLILADKLLALAAADQVDVDRWRWRVRTNPMGTGHPANRLGSARRFTAAVGSGCSTCCTGWPHHVARGGNGCSGRLELELDRRRRAAGG